MKMQTFIFEIPIVAHEYSPETCKEEYGSEDCHNPDFPAHVHAAGVLQQLFQDASTQCRFMAMKELAKHKEEEDPEKWPEPDRAYFKGLTRRADYWDELMMKTKFARMEQT